MPFDSLISAICVCSTGCVLVLLHWLTMLNKNWEQKTSSTSNENEINEIIRSEIKWMTSRRLEQKRTNWTEWSVLRTLQQKRELSCTRMCVRIYFFRRLSLVFSPSLSVWIANSRGVIKWLNHSNAMMKMRDGEATKNKMWARASVLKQPFGKPSDKSLIHDINFSFGVGSDSQPQPIQHKRKLVIIVKFINLRAGWIFWTV